MAQTITFMSLLFLVALVVLLMTATCEHHCPLLQAQLCPTNKVLHLGDRWHMRCVERLP